MAFAQLTYREMPTKSEIGTSTPILPTRSSRPARKLYANDSFALELENTVYALGATTIDLCLSMFPWANFRKSKGAIKLHTLLDLRGNIPTFIHISDGKLHEVNTLDILPLEAGAFYVMDRGYLDFSLGAIRLGTVGFFLFWG